MKKYVWGISKRFSTLVDSGIIKVEELAGAFDKNVERIGEVVNGLKVEAPCEKENAEILITTGDQYVEEIAWDAIQLNFRKITYWKHSDGQFIRHTVELSHSFEYDRDNLVVLNFESTSYSNIYAIMELIKDRKVDVGELRFEPLNMDLSSFEHKYQLKAARYIVTECSWREHWKTDAEIIQLWHGFPLKGMGNMQVQSEEYVANKINWWKSFDIVASYGINYQVLMSACYAISKSKYIDCGMPRNDLLFQRNSDISFESIFPATKDKKIVLYMPTFRQIEAENTVGVNGTLDGYIYNWDGFSFEEFDRFCGENDLFFIFKLHPKEAALIDCTGNDYQNIGFLNEQMLNGKSVYEYFYLTDALMTDYSSTYFDYLLLDKPVIFAEKDIEEYIINRGVVLDPLDFWRPGDKVSDYEQFTKALKKVANAQDDYATQRKELLPFIYKYADGNATQRLLDYLNERKTNGKSI